MDTGGDSETVVSAIESGTAIEWTFCSVHAPRLLRSRRVDSI